MLSYKLFEESIGESLRRLDAEWEFGLRGAVKTQLKNGYHAKRGGELKIINQSLCSKLNLLDGFHAYEPAAYGDGRFANLHVTDTRGASLWLETQLAYSAYFDDFSDPDYKFPKASILNGLWSKKVDNVFADCAKLAAVQYDLAAALLIVFAVESDNAQMPAGVPSEKEITRYVFDCWKFRPEVQGWRFVDVDAGGIKKAIDAAPTFRFTTRVWMIERPTKV
jgi:hypothetical protein